MDQTAIQSGAPGPKPSETGVSTGPPPIGVNGSTARFVCHVAVARADDLLFEARGVIEGTIANEPRGTNGFGYDPIFFYPPLGRTLADLTTAEKSAVSHRGQAFTALRDELMGV